jgi:AcrR family transcriptional regulator
MSEPGLSLADAASERSARGTDRADRADRAAENRGRRRAGRRKTAVLDAACQVIASRGVEATRFTDVAEASGVPVSTLQYYFGSREDLLVAAFRHASASELAAMAAEADAEPSAWERIRMVITRALAGYHPVGAAGPAGPASPASPESGRLWIESWHFAIRDTEMRVDALRDYAGWRQLIADAVRLGTASGEFSPALSPERIAVLAIALADGTGIPLALEDPQLTVVEATADVLTTIDALLHAS